MKRITFILAVLFVCCGAKLPIAPPYYPQAEPYTGAIVIEPEQEHTGKVIVKPTKLTHTSHYGCQCPMCRGLHLANKHGITNDQWNKLKLWQGSKMDAYHAKLHREGVYEKPKDGCPGGVCRPPVRPVRRLLGRWR